MNRDIREAFPDQLHLSGFSYKVLDMAAQPDTQLSFVLNHNTKSTAHLSLKESGDVDVHINHLGDEQTVSDASKLTATATECSWNVYATAKLPQSTQVSNRAQLVDITSDGHIIRVGSTIFMPQSSSALGPFKKFTPPKFSLYVDKIEQHGQNLFVTSRQDITTIPELKDEPVKDADTKSGSAGFKPNDTEEGTKVDVEPSTGSKTATADDKSNEAKDGSSDDDDDSADKLPEADDEDSSNDLSADESWSEGSTEYDSDQKIADFRPQRPQEEKAKGASDSESSDSEQSQGDATEDSEVQDNAVEGSDKEGAAMSSDEEERMFDAIFINDRIDPQSDEEGGSSAAGVEEDDFPDWGDFDSGDGYQPVESDSEECSECGGDSGSCPLPQEDATTLTSKDEEESEVEEAIGIPVAHIHVYDTSRCDDQGTPTRVFHFRRPTQETLARSPPAIHPNRSLVVWPLGDGKVLFADYEYNTYFVRKFQTSRFWSSHVSINCHFSDDGKHLHVVALEKSGRPPTLPKRKTKAKSKGKEGAQKPKKEKPKYELIMSTYRMSDSKTTRVPPLLMRRVQKDLGELSVLPTVTWRNGHVYVCVPKETTCDVYQIDLESITANKVRRSKEGKMALRCLTTDIPEWATGRELYFMPTGNNAEQYQLIVMGKVTKIPPYKPVSSNNSQSSSKTTTSEEFNVELRTETSSAKPGLSKAETRSLSNDCEDEDSKTDKIEDTTTRAATTASEGQSNDTSSEQDKSDESLTTALTTTDGSDKDKSKNETKSKEKPEPPKSTHPGTMVAYLSAEDIKNLGGWRDVLTYPSTDPEEYKNSTTKVGLTFQPIGRDVEF